MNSIFGQFLSSPAEVSATFTLAEIIITLFLCFGLCLFVGYVYKWTHRGTSYSQSYVHTMIISGVVVSIIMLIIGSNIARAFTLVGALSIVRFRNAIKETKDVGYIFLSMAIGMACGTRFYMMAMLFTFLITAFIYILFRFDILSAGDFDKLLRINVPADWDYKQALANVFNKFLVQSALLSIVSPQGSPFMQLNYSVEFKKGVSSKDFLDEINAVTGHTKVEILLNSYNSDI
jgi:uncharacterized membrane protein YhiD involved in acid resistance